MFIVWGLARNFMPIYIYWNNASGIKLDCTYWLGPFVIFLYLFHFKSDLIQIIFFETNIWEDNTSAMAFMVLAGTLFFSSVSWWLILYHSYRVLRLFTFTFASKWPWPTFIVTFLFQYTVADTCFTITLHNDYFLLCIKWSWPTFVVTFLWEMFLYCDRNTYYF